MKRIVKLTESDLTRIVKRVLTESTVNKKYFWRRGIEIEKLLEESLSQINVCKYAKIKTYFNHLMDNIILKLYVSNETMRDELEKNEDNLEREIRKFFINEYLDFLMYYYKLKCGKEVK